MLARNLSKLLFNCSKIKPFAFDSQGKPLHQPSQPSLQQPFLNDKLVQDTIQRIYKSNKKQVLQLLNLMDAKITPRNHTIINQSCFRLLNFQKQMTKQQIVSVLELCVKAQVSNLTFVQHFENQLLHKFDGPVKQLIDEFYSVKGKEIQKMWTQLEKNSHDVFEILNDPQSMKIEEENDDEVEEQQSNQNQIEEIKNDQVTQMSQQSVKKAGKLIKQFGYIGFLLIELRVQSTNLFKVFQQLFLTMAGSHNVQLKTLLQFIHINNHICLKTQQEYQKNKVYYIKRSIKKIKKYQLVFYEKMLPLIKDILPKLRAHQVHSLYHAMLKFKIKSNRPYTYLFQMFKDWTTMPAYVYSEDMMSTLFQLMQDKPKIISKLKQLNIKLIEQFKNKQQNIVKKLEQKGST